MTHPTSHAAPAGIDLDSDYFTASELDELESVATAAPSTWYGTYQIIDGISDEKAVELIEACSPYAVRTLINMARSALARNAACAPAADERALFDAAYWKIEPHAEVVWVDAMWDGTMGKMWQARAALAQNAASPAPAAQAVDAQELLQLLRDARHRICNDAPGGIGQHPLDHPVYGPLLRRLDAACEELNHSPATSAADAKDAERYRVLRNVDFSDAGIAEIRNKAWAVYLDPKQQIPTMIACRGDVLDAVTDAAIAASQKGTEA